MNKFLIVLLFLAVNSRLHAQQFSQYNTGTLYDSFENPTQKAFTPDSSRKVAINLFVPNFNFDFTFVGNAQSALRTRAFLNNYIDPDLTIGKNNFNYLNGNFNAYFFMLKVYTNLAGDGEIGFSGQTRAEARGVFTDESAQILADNTKFTNASYSDVFNSRYSYQVYHQLSIHYRQNVDERFALGIKVSALFGVVANKVDITHSVINFDRPNDQAFLSLSGNYRATFQPGAFTTHDLIPNSRNPGASVSIGASYLTDNHIRMQFNVKDLGFIHWSNQSSVGDFNNTAVIQGLTQPGAEDSITRAASALIETNSATKSFTTPTDGHFEFSAATDYWLNGTAIKYSPTVVLSKQLFYRGFTGALVNHFQYNNFVFTTTGSYDDMHLFSLGIQLMVKSPNAEFFIGSDRLTQTVSALRAGLNADYNQSLPNGAFTGANIYMGFSFKLGPVIEHRENASNIPMEEHTSFFKRFWERITTKGS